MKILIHAIYADANPRGVGRYCLTLVSKLTHLYPDAEFIILVGNWMSGYPFEEIVNNMNTKVVRVRIPKNIIARNLWNLFVFPFISKFKYKVDLIHLTDSSPLIFSFCPVISTIHDAGEFIMPEKYGLIRSFIRRIVARLQIRFSHSIITVSETSKKSLTQLKLGREDKITTVYNGVDMVKYSEVDDEKESYVLCVGPVEEAKNIRMAIQAFEQVINEAKFSGLKLFVTGSMGEGGDYIIRMVNDLKLKEKVIFLGRVSDERLSSLYYNAKAMLFLSMYEGFGYPIIEAMQLGCPVICSNMSCLPEVSGGHAFLVNPKNKEDITKKLLYVLENKNNLCIKLQQAQEYACYFSSESLAVNTFEVYNNVVK